MNVRGPNCSCRLNGSSFVHFHFLPRRNHYTSTMMASYGRASYSETKTAETLLFRSHRFEALQEYAHCSAASIIQLACVVALKAYASAESINFLGEDQKWLLWNTPLSPKSRIFELLCKPNVASADSVTISKANLTEYALIVSSFRDGCPLNMAQEALPSLHAVKAVHPQVSPSPSN